jgi:hypothetical protein
MHASSSDNLPRIGERYSSDDLFDRYPGYWALLAFPDGLTPDQEWNIMATPGVLVALEKSRSALWMKRRAYRQTHPDATVYHFATESLDDLAIFGAVQVQFS